MTKHTEILHKNQEFFTIIETGESGTSLRGLSRLSGIPKSTLSRWFDSDLSHESVPEELKLMLAKALDLSHEQSFESFKALAQKALYLSREIRVRGKVVLAIRAEIVAEVIEYAALELGKPEAKLILKATNKIGTASYLQGETGYLPEIYQASSVDSRHEINRLIKDADPWKALFSSRTCELIRKWYFPRDFFWKFAYSWMTPEEIDFLDKYNPVLPDIWQRENRIFQHLSQETRDRIAPEIAALCGIVNSSTSRQDFETRYNRSKGIDQGEIFNA
jgi:hypothetical protein